MTAYAALLRAVNVGGRTLAMSDLRAVAEGIGLENVATVLQSGNLVFTARHGRGATLERELQRAVLERLGLETVFFVRDAKSLGRVVDENPFVREAESDPAHLLMYALSGVVPEARVKALRTWIPGSERVAVAGSTLYAVYPDGIGRSKLTAGAIESRLEVSSTGRNWNTVAKLLAAVVAKNVGDVSRRTKGSI